MAIETLPEPSIPIATPFRPGLGFLTATPIIAAATICLALVIASAILAPWLSPHDPLVLGPAQRLEAAISVGSSLPKIMWRHLMPNTIAPLIVQGTYVCASAILTEAILSFLGAGISPETPTWGNIMAEGRAYFQIKPSLIFWPGLLLW